MRPPSFEIFLILSNCLRSEILSRSVSREAAGIPSLFYLILSFVLLVENQTRAKIL